jgi:hypothetical protein
MADSEEVESRKPERKKEGRISVFECARFIVPQKKANQPRLDESLKQSGNKFPYFKTTLPEA